MFQLFQRPTCPLLRDSSDIKYTDFWLPMQPFAHENSCRSDFLCLYLFLERFPVWKMGRRFFGIRYVWMDYSQSTASAVLRHRAELVGILMCLENLNSTASAVLRLENARLRSAAGKNLNSTASAVLRLIRPTSSRIAQWNLNSTASAVLRH